MWTVKGDADLLSSRLLPRRPLRGRPLHLHRVPLCLFVLSSGTGLVRPNRRDRRHSLVGVRRVPAADGLLVSNQNPNIKAYLTATPSSAELSTIFIPCVKVAADDSLIEFCSVDISHASESFCMAIVFDKAETTWSSG